MKRRLFFHLVIVAAILSLAAPVRAGGVATVYLDSPPEGVTVGVPWSFGFMVMQHDVSPVNVDRAHVFAQHRESGESIESVGRQEGEIGHYVAELTFPRAGSWKWSITPEPFAGTSFESIVVLDEAGSADSGDASAGHPVHIHSGSCAKLGEVMYPLSDVGPSVVMKDGAPLATSGSIGATAADDVSISETTIEVTIAELISSPHAINVHKSAEDITTYVGCGDISGRMWNGSLIIGLQPLNNSGDAGIAVLTETGERTTVTLYMLVISEGGTTAQSGPTVNVEIKGAEGSWKFVPARLEIKAGMTVVWTNNTDVSHTVTGSDLAFEDSGPFGEGETFSQTFTEPGTYDYFCSPHPFMTGTVIVT